MITGSVIVAIIFGALTLGLRIWWHSSAKSPAQAVSETDHKMLEDAENRPDSVDDAIDRL